MTTDVDVLLATEEEHLEVLNMIQEKQTGNHENTIPETTKLC